MSKRLDVAEEQLWELNTWNEDSWRTFLAKYGEDLNLSQSALEKRKQSSRSHSIFSNRRHIVRKLAETPELADNISQLVLSNNFFKHKDIIKSLSRRVFEDYWNRNDYFVKGQEGFIKVIDLEDIEKLNTFYSEKGGIYLSFDSMDISSHRDVDTFEKALAFAIKKQDLDLMKKVYDSQEFFMYREKSEVVIEAFCSVSEYVNSDLLAKMRTFMKELKGTTTIYKKALDKGYSKFLNNSPTLMFKMNVHTRRNFYNKRFHYRNLMPSKQFIQFMNGEVSSSKLEIHGDKSSYNYAEAMKENKEKLMLFWNALNSKSGRTTVSHFEYLTRYYDDRFISEQTSYPYITAMMLNRPEKVTPDLIASFKKQLPKQRPFMKNLRERLASVDNVEAFIEAYGESATYEKDLHYARISALYGSKKMLAYFASRIGSDPNWKIISNSMKSE